MQNLFPLSPFLFASVHSCECINAYGPFLVVGNQIDMFAEWLRNEEMNRSLKILAFAKSHDDRPGYCSL